MCLPCARLRIRCAAAMLCLGSGIPCGSPSRSHGSDTRQEDAPPPPNTHTHTNLSSLDTHALLPSATNSLFLFPLPWSHILVCAHCAFVLLLHTAGSRWSRWRIHLYACPTSASSLSVNTYFRSRRCSPDASLPCLHAVHWHCHALCAARTYLSLSSKKCQKK